MGEPIALPALTPENRALVEPYFVGSPSGSMGTMITWSVLNRALNAAREEGRRAPIQAQESPDQPEVQLGVGSGIDTPSGAAGCPAASGPALPQTAPGAWVLVPREPTEEMITALSGTSVDSSYRRGAAEAYRAMIAASPSAPQAGEGEA